MSGISWIGTRTVLALLLVAACAGPRRQARMMPSEPGSALFDSYCAACHQADGSGAADTPALAGSPWVSGPAARLIKIVLHGVQGRMEVAGKSFDREMPGFGTVLSDQEVSLLVSFLRRRFGGEAGPVPSDTVNRIRAAHRERTKYWTVEELLADADGLR